jgi:hypothetical protein
MPMTRRRVGRREGVPRFVCLVSVWTEAATNYFLKAASSVCIMALSMPSAAACGRHFLEHFPAGSRRYDTVAKQRCVSYIPEFVGLQIYNIIKLKVL